MFHRHPAIHFSLLVAMCCAVAVPGAGAASPSAEAPLAKPRRGFDPGNVPLNNSVKVSPTRIELEPATAGRTYDRRITVRNRKATTTTFTIESVGLRPSTADDTTLQLVPDDEGRRTARGWVKVPAGYDSFQLKPREYVDIPIDITVPANASTGGSYAAVVVRSESTRINDAGAIVGVQSEVAIPLLATVPGDIVRSFDLDRAKAPLIVWDRESYQATWRARNTGNVHLSLRPRTRVRSAFGSTVTRIDGQGRLLLPGGSGRIETNWKRTPWIGIYKVETSVQDVERASTTQDGGTRWLITLPPWWVLALAAAAIITPIVVRRLRRTPDDDVEGTDETDASTDDESHV